MKKIPLTQNKMALIDNSDYPIISLFKWCASKVGSFFAGMNMNLKINKKRGSSIYRGVHLEKRNKNWHAQISIKGKYFHLGYFKNEIAAAKAYNKIKK